MFPRCETADCGEDGASRAGNSMVKQVPYPLRERTCTEPPAARVKFRTIASPYPRPDFAGWAVDLVENPDSKMCGKNVRWDSIACVRYAQDKGTPLGGGTLLKFNRQLSALGHGIDAIAHQVQ